MKKILEIFFLTIIIGGLFICKSTHLAHDFYARVKAPEEPTEVNEIRFNKFTLKLDLILNKEREGNNNTCANGLAVDIEGNMYIVDTNNHRIKIYSNLGEHIKTLEKKGNMNENFNLPVDLVLDKNFNIYVAEISNSGVQILSKEGKSKSYFKFKQGCPFTPEQLVTDNEFLYILERDAEHPKYNIHKYSLSGEYVASFGKVSTSGDFVKKITEKQAYLSSDSLNNLYIAYSFFPKVQKYSPKGELLHEFSYTSDIKDQKKSFLVRIRDMQSRTMRYRAKFYPICTDISIDNSGKIYLLIALTHGKNWQENCSLYQFDQDGYLLEKVALPIKCRRIHIDNNNNFYFLSCLFSPSIYRYKYVPD
jgi:hypothetical protein